MFTGNVVNIFGGPGCGKSTLAALLYSELKRQGIEVEYVNEYPKQLVYEENVLSLQNQILVFATQHHRIWTAARHNQIVITDSPILLSTIYHPETSEHFRELIIEMHNKFTNLNIVLKRVDSFHSMTGRIHTLQESMQIDTHIHQMLEALGADYLEFNPAIDPIAPLVKLIYQEFS
jgi:ABC-type transporter Mla maintaining outer membrane lipid asymmetry ATPase subunit MlaF